MDFSFNHLSDKKFKFYDHSLVEAIKLGDSSVHEFFRLLSLCHTIMAEEKNEGTVRFYILINDRTDGEKCDQD